MARRIGGKVAWILGRMVKIFGNTLSFVARRFHGVKRGRVMCWAYNFKQYSCNPRYLTEHLLEHHPEMEVYWVFRRGVDCSKLDPRIHVVRFRSWRYYVLTATAEYLVTNSRTDPYHIYWHKRPEQKYLMLWHGGVALKRVERDAEKMLGYSYVRKARRDSEVCDLMISGCRMQSDLIRSSFWYRGEILECGIPRNDIFFNTALHAELNEKIRLHYDIAPESRIVLYAPTFRRSGSIEPYRLNWAKILPALRKMFATEHVTVFVRMHPNLIGKIDIAELVAYDDVKDVTLYNDMQELLAVSDMLITDYSSSMFDFTMQYRPCMLYATDVASYDRGYYFDFRELPFPLAEGEEQLIEMIRGFDYDSYRRGVEEFFTSRIGFYESGHAAEALAEWMVAHTMK